MAYDNTPKIDVIRQNQTQNVRELLKSKNWINLLSTYEFMGYVELWVDYIMNGPTEKNKERFKKFDQEMLEREKKAMVEVDGVIL